MPSQIAGGKAPEFAGDLARSVNLASWTTPKGGPAVSPRCLALQQHAHVPRHEYFRRILCNSLGNDIRRGHIPNDEKMIGAICYFNAARYFNFKVPMDL